MSEHMAAAQAGTLVGGPRRYRKKPVVIEAIVYDGTNIEALWEFATAEHIYGPTPEDPNAYVLTMEGKHTIPVGNYVIRGVAGEYYSCDPVIFAATYEPA